MKMLMFAASNFCWRPFERTLPDAAAPGGEVEVQDAAVIFIQVETGDIQAPKIVTKAVKNVKWMARKRGLQNIVLHSFTHLGGESADPALALSLLEKMADRLRGVGYQVVMPPFGWVCEWDLHVYGEGLAKVFKSL